MPDRENVMWMVRPIDGYKLYDQIEARYRQSSGEEHRIERELLDAICDSPTIDAIPVVRCRDCVHYNTTGYGAGLGWCEGAVVSTGVWDNFYCADGERKWHKWQRWQKEDK